MKKQKKKETESTESNDSEIKKEKVVEEGDHAATVEKYGAENAQEEELDESTENTDDKQTIEVEKTAQSQKEKKVIQAQAEVEAAQPQEEKESSHSSATAEDLFDNDDNEESDFLATIERQKEDDELSKLRAELEELTQENKQLKFLNMENETTVDDLQEQLQEREDMINSLENDLQTIRDELMVTQQRLKEAETKSGRNSTPTPVQFADFNTSGNNSTPLQSATNFAAPMARGNHVEVDRVMLDKWRHWNVDMTTWRSIGSGPIMEF